MKMFGSCFGTFLKCSIFDVVALKSGFGTWLASETVAEDLGRNGGNDISCHR